MSGGSHIRAVGSESGADAPSSDLSGDADALTLEESWMAESPAADTWEDPVEPRREWRAPFLGGIAVAGWSAVFLWAYWSAMTGGVTPQVAVELIVQWTVPILLIAAIWLIAMRTSRREAARFTDVANGLRAESAALESRLATVNGELSLAREFLAAQSRELETLGRIATQRISEHADRLQALVHDNGNQVDLIAGVSRTALDNMERLRGDLPVIANAARDAANQIGGAGQAAHDQLAGLTAGFVRLNEFGQASERQVGALTVRVDAAIAGFEAQAAQLDDIAGARFVALREKSEAFRAELDGREVEALAAMRHRADRLRDELGTTSALLDMQEGELLKSLQSRVTALRDSADLVGNRLAEGERDALALWQQRVASLKSDLAASIAEVEAIDIAAKRGAEQRLAAISEEAASVDAKLTESHALFVGEIGRRREEATALAAAQVAHLTRQLDEIDGAIEARRVAHAEAADTLVQRIESTAALAAGAARQLQDRVAELETALARAGTQGEAAQGTVARAIDALSGQLSESGANLAEVDRSVAALTEASVRLLELIQASARHSSEQLPPALGEAERRLQALIKNGEGLAMLLGEASARSSDLSNYVVSAREESAGSIDQIEAFRLRVTEMQGEQAEGLRRLRDDLAVLSNETEALATRARETLAGAIGTLDGSARSAIENLGTRTAENVRALAESIGEQAASAVDRALENKVTVALNALDDSAAHSLAQGHAAATQLRDQLARVNELAGNLENRVAVARQRAEEQVDNDFSRRVALITESLNSNAIDIARALSTEVTDTAWASYLRGDRGIFTRRAVKLLEPAAAREVAELYDANADFREHVSRYIHDFEAMLRTMLSTRDGHAIGVTLLSSDMGKLYVALAQAIERLRD